MVTRNEYVSRSAAARALATAVADSIRGCEAGEQRARIVLCGGSSPIEMFGFLADQAVPWDQVTVMPSDERWVAPDHPDSNERVLRETLLQGPATSAQVWGLYRAQATPGQAVAEINHDLASVQTPFEHVVLGMGSDGHTASIFPHAANIEELLASCERVVVPELPTDETPRISLSVPCLVYSRAISILFFGDDKRAVFDRAAAGAPPTSLPIASILNHAPVPVNVYWAP